jgi:hypothetical protein
MKGLLWMQLLILIAVVLPAAVAAVVTSSIVQVLICIALVALYGIGMGALSSVLPNMDEPSATTVSNFVSVAIPVALGLLVIVMQFGWRRTWASRLVIIGLALVGVLMAVSSGYSSNVANEYPPPGAGERPAAQLEILSRNIADEKRSDVPSGAKKVSVSFNMVAGNVADGTVARLDGTVISIAVPNGPRWSSNWQSRYWEFWPGGSGQWPISAEIDRKFYEKNQNTPVNVHFVMAITGYRLTGTRDVTARAGEFVVPGVGTCWVDTNGFGSRWIGCRAPLQQPSFVAQVDSSASTCTPERGEDPDLHESLYSWMVSDDSDPADFGIIPVKFFEFVFSEPLSRPESPQRKPPMGVCPGTPFTILRAEIFQHTRVEAELDGVRLSDYVQPRTSVPFR